MTIMTIVTIMTIMTMTTEIYYPCFISAVLLHFFDLRRGGFYDRGHQNIDVQIYDGLKNNEILQTKWKNRIVCHRKTSFWLIEVAETSISEF